MQGNTHTYQGCILNFFLGGRGGLFLHQNKILSITKSFGISSVFISCMNMPHCLELKFLSYSNAMSMPILMQCLCLF